jgi:hypothetical protein
VKKAVFFVSNEVQNWHIQGWPFDNLVKRLINEGKTIEVVLEEPDLTGLNARQLTELLEAKSKYQLKILSTKPIDNFTPLLQVDYYGKPSDLYFSEEINNDFSYEWGESQNPIYKSSINNNLQTQNWDIDIFNLLNDDQILFEFKIREKHSSLKTFFDTLRKHEEDKWKNILSSIRDSSVRIIYRDTYLVDPIGCMMIAQLVKDLKNSCNLSISSLEFDLSSFNKFNGYPDGRIDENFSSKQKRTEFLMDYSLKLIGTNPIVYEEGRLPHWRELIIDSDSFELVIRPHGGIKNGWALDFNEEIQDVEEVEISDDLKLFNKSLREGILYNIIFQKR